MATTPNFTTGYSGKKAGGYFRSAFMANETLQHVDVKLNIDYRQVVKRLIDDVTFSAPSCNFTPTGEVTLNERWLTLKKLQVQREICLNWFLDDYVAADAQNKKLDSEFSEAFILNMIEAIAMANENMIWTGNGSNANEYDGLLQLIGQDSDNDIIFAPSPVTIDKTNVFAKIEAVIALMPDRVKYANEKPTLYLDAATWEAFMNASASNGNGWYIYGGAAVPRVWMGTFNIAVCPGLPASTIVFARKSNLWFGTNILNDWNDIQVVDMTQFADDTFRFSAKFFAATQYGIGSEIVAYSTWF